MGLKPGNPDGSFVQNVPLIGFQATRVSGSFLAGGQTIGLEFPKNFVAMPGRAGEQPKIADSEVVFVGHSVDWPEYGWDDFKGLDVRGKTLIMLVGDPPVPDSTTHPGSIRPCSRAEHDLLRPLDLQVRDRREGRGGGRHHRPRERTGRIPVLGGSGKLEPARTSISRPASCATPAPAVPVRGWIDSPTAKALCQAAGLDIAALGAAIRRDFRPVVLNARAGFDIAVKTRQVQSRNVIAKLEGSDPAFKNRVCRLHGPLGSSGHRSQPQGRPDL